MWGQIEPKPDQIEPVWDQIVLNTGKLKILIQVKWTFGGHLWPAIMLLAILDGSYYQKSQRWLQWPYY